MKTQIYSFEQQTLWFHLLGVKAEGGSTPDGQHECFLEHAVIDHPDTCFGAEAEWKNNSTK